MKAKKARASEGREQEAEGEDIQVVEEDGFEGMMEVHNEKLKAIPAFDERSREKATSLKHIWFIKWSFRYG